jgi:crotonobetainyl-CoA:carnitine CoA-transferase CaiB-like acyl-CoA transferase
MPVHIPGALDGILVLDLSRMLPGPYCSMILADHGARVIAIEGRRFQADGLYFDTVNRNKEHMSLNLKSDVGRDIFFRLAERSDVVIEGFRPGVAERLGIGYEAVRERNPAVVYCSISGYGQTGPWRKTAGHDLNFLARSGVLDLIGYPDRPPAIPGIQIADMAGGGLQAAVGILLSLFARQRTGRGQYIDVSMTDGSAALLPLAWWFRQRRDGALRRGAWMLSHEYACYNVYETADGRFLAVGALEDRFWRRLCQGLGLEELADHQYDEDRRAEIVKRFRDLFRTRSLTEWEEKFADMDACVCGVQTMDELAEDSLFRKREMVVDLEGADGAPLTTLGVPVKLDRTPGSVRTPPPAFGADTRAVLRELGYPEDRIDALYREGIV